MTATTSRKGIVFVDFHGTLCHDTFWRSFPVNIRASIDDWLYKKNRSIVRDWMNGKLTTERVVDLVSRQFHLDYGSTLHQFVEECKDMFIPAELVESIRELRRIGWVTCLITGNADCFSRFTVPTTALAEVFSEIVSSNQLGFQKQEFDGVIFQHLASIYELPLDACYLVDDDSTVQAAFSRLGGNSLLCTSLGDTRRHLREIVNKSKAMQPVSSSSETVETNKLNTHSTVP